jgi:hypothetical protein
MFSSTPPTRGTLVRTEAERIELVTQMIDQVLSEMSSPYSGRTPSSTGMLLELTQTREIMLANKEEIDGGR